MDTANVRAFLKRRFSREEAVGVYFTASLFVCIVLAVAVGLLAEEISRVAPAPERIDRVVGAFLYGFRSNRLTPWMRALTFLGDYRFLMVATPAVGVSLLLARHPVSALLFVGSVVGGFGVTATLKIALARSRPDLWPALIQEASYSFPSGHAAMSTVFFGGLVAVVFHLSHRRSYRIAAVLVAFVLVAGVGSSRVYLGAHWATDTLAGMMVGLFWVVVYAGGTEYASRIHAAGGPRRNGA